MRKIEKRTLALLIGLLVVYAVIHSVIVVLGGSGDFLWKKKSDPSIGKDEAYGVAVDGTGVYTVGYDQVLGGSDGRWRIQKRSLTTGAVIWTKKSNPTSGNDVANDVAVDGTGVYIVGFDTSGSRWRIEKRLANGNRDWLKTHDPSGSQDVARGVAVDSTAIYVVGYDSVNGYPDTQWRIQKRSKTTGAVMWTKKTNPSSGTDVAVDVAVDGTGVYIVGYCGSGSDTWWKIERRSLTTGDRVWGKKINPSSSGDAAMGVAVDGTGVYVVGRDSVPAPYDSRWRIEKRSKADGSRMWKKTPNPSGGTDDARGVAVDGTNLYIVGYNTGGYYTDIKWRIEKRSTTDGSLIWKKNSNPTAGWDYAEDVAVDGNGVYTVGNTSLGAVSTDTGYRIEKREK